MLKPTAKTRIEEGDVFLVDLFAPDPNIDRLQHDLGLQPTARSGRYFADRAQQLGMVEVILPEGSGLIGKSILGAEFRTRYGVTVVGFRRGRTATTTGFMDQTLKVGDTLLLVGFWTDIRKLQAQRADMVVLNLPAELDEVLPAADKAPQALVCLAVVIVLMVTGWVPNVQAAFIGCLLMGALGCVDFQSAYRSIHWPSLVLIVGMLPFSTALQRTGGVDLAANTLVGIIGEAEPRLVLAALFTITAALGLFISNTATAVLMGPVAFAIAAELGDSPYPFAMTVALAASAAFMTPVSSPVNTLVVGPGNYRFGDFVRIGVPFTVVVLLITVLLVPILLPFK